MATVDNTSHDVFNCNICNKSYKDRTGLWKHNKKYHIQTSTINPQTSTINPQTSAINPQTSTINPQNTNILQCSFCNKILSRSDSIKRHLLICKEKKCDKTTTIVNNDLTNQISQMQKDINQLKNNKIVKNYNNGTYVNGNVVNGSNNNKITINKTGTENILELNDTEVTDIFNKEIEGVIKLIEFVNFNERLPSNHQTS